MRRPLPAVALCVALLLGAGCATPGARTDDLRGDRKLQVVAAENVWGSIAAQLGGTRVDVTSIVASPAVDPHSYEATAADARAIADADLVIVNGLGYDAWAGKAVAANPSPIRAVIDVGHLTGHHAGDNPHRWYYPADVDRVATAISHDYQRLDPRHAPYYARRLVAFRSSSLAAYHRTLADLRRRYAGTPVGASESIFDGLAGAIGLRLVTPARFLDAVSEGSDVTAAELHARRPAPGRHGARGPHPGGAVHRDALPCRRHLPAVAGGAAAGARAGPARGDGSMTTPQADTAPTVVMTGGAVTRRGRLVWHDVSTTIEAGRFVAVLGPNGAGKSTFIQALLGEVRLDQGSLTVLGEAPGDAHDRIGYLPQRRTFAAGAPIRGVDLVGLGLDGHRWGVPVPWSGGRHTRRARVAEMIDLVDATPYATRSIGDVSGGEQQRLLIAQALVRDPALLLLDEPLDSLDLPSQAAIAALLARLSRERGMTIVLVAHDVNPLLGYLDQVVYLGRGHAMSGPPEAVVTSESLTRLYGTPVEVLRASDGRSVVVGQPEAPAVHTDRHGAAPHHHGH